MFLLKIAMRNSLIFTLELVLYVTAIDCGGGYPSGKLQQREQISTCGGFTTTDKIWLGDPAAYCDAEVLHWSYQLDTHTLQLIDTRAYLNCCSERHIFAELTNGVYLVTETIGPDAAKGWCRCLCVFDLSIDIQEVSGTEVKIKIVRDVNDNVASKIVLYNDTIDLAPLSGTISLNETAIDPGSCPGAALTSQ